MNEVVVTDKDKKAEQLKDLLSGLKKKTNDGIKVLEQDATDLSNKQAEYNEKLKDYKDVTNVRDEAMLNNAEAIHRTVTVQHEINEQLKNTSTGFFNYGNSYFNFYNAEQGQYNYKLIAGVATVGVLLATVAYYGVKYFMATTTHINPDVFDAVVGEFLPGNSPQKYIPLAKDILNGHVAEVANLPRDVLSVNLNNAFAEASGTSLADFTQQVANHQANPSTLGHALGLTADQGVLIHQTLKEGYVNYLGSAAQSAGYYLFKICFVANRLPAMRADELNEEAECTISDPFCEAFMRSELTAEEIELNYAVEVNQTMAGIVLEG